MKRFEFKKLIRNKLPVRMIEERVVIYPKTLSYEEFCQALRHKLIEEAEEVSQAQEVKDIIVELADVLEVIHALAEAYQLSFSDIEKTRLSKREINGYFDQETYMDYIEVDENNHKVIQYLLDKNRPYKFK
ncbi:Nucleoside triphosphate pyrophosphohydrolase [Candidatus Trichorickettsia mobilis]|uniref:Nucleoside triphosphate pyrophosphohydrolase n=1 Tax=Candidatus Trichorickettsia mobilis TaxID=1346319 RepID=A0ABZ0UTM6_9RICK|nr:nucleoside triphosphate pyrophosphohydrolase [Candidatus Trichorickettsia mobilis]WPY01395.1 Nucleoside triphosphate pyrophosphohydrolase [Candidatus Trichorickettsia mobilis]